MKRKLLPIVITGIAALTAQAAMAAPTVYGKFNVSLNKVDEEKAGDDSTDNWELLSHSSRLGFKGDADINDSLKAVYKLEYGVEVDDGAGKDKEDDNGDKVAGDTISQRNIYVGVQGDWGTVLAGRHDTPLKMAQGKVDQFNDLAETSLSTGDIKDVIEGENRMSNIVGYVSPKVNNISGTVFIIPGEGDGVSDNAADDRNGPADGISANVKYKADGLYVALGIDQDVKNRDIIRLVGQFSADNFTVGGIVSNGSSNDTDIADVDTTALLLSASFNVSDTCTLKAQFGTRTDEYNVLATDNEADTTLLTIGADHKLSKATTAYVYYGQAEVDADMDAGDEEASTFGIGMIHKF